jgi:hypothetical protein
MIVACFCGKVIDRKCDRQLWSSNIGEHWFLAAKYINIRRNAVVIGLWEL